MGSFIWSARMIVVVVLFCFVCNYFLRPVVLSLLGFI